MECSNITYEFKIQGVRLAVRVSFENKFVIGQLNFMILHIVESDSEINGVLSLGPFHRCSIGSHDEGERIRRQSLRIDRTVRRGYLLCESMTGLSWEPRDLCQTTEILSISRNFVLASGVFSPPRRKAWRESRYRYRTGKALGSELIEQIVRINLS